MAITNSELNKIRIKGIDILTKELGPVNMAYFIQQYDDGYGDYTKERKEIFDGVSLDEIIDDIKNMKSK